MAKPTTWATAKIKQEVDLANSGIEIVVWDKYHRHRKGKLTVSVGGLKWLPYHNKQYYHASWNRLEKLFLALWEK